MAKSNFFVTAAGLNLGLLALSALSYWYTQNNSQQENESENDSSLPSSSAGNVSHETRSVCGVCHKEIESNPITTLACGHKVHSHCFHQVETNGLICPMCATEINTE